jgi:ActR/RegA family two-component response regulator
MISTGKILLIDDDPEFIQAYRNLLTPDYEVDVATSAHEARAKLLDGGHSVVLLDQKLQGSSGPDSGLDLLAEMTHLAPSANVIVATAYASPAAIRRAFEAGAYEYLEKNPKTFDTLLPIKLRNAVEIYRERMLARLTSDPAASARHLTELWRESEQEVDRNRKGRLLEDMISLLFRSIPGFESQVRRMRDGVKEIDITIVNHSTDPVWSREGTFVLVECKNQREPVPAPQLLILEGKMRRFRGRCQLGFLVAPSGFTGPLRTQQTASSTERLLIVPIGREDLERLISTEDRNAVMKELFVRATATLGGGDK